MGRQLKLAQVESEILQYSSSANFPQPTGSIKYLYLDQTASTLYRWDTVINQYVLLNSPATPTTSGSAEGEVYFADLVTSARLAPCTYDNGVSGSGATLTSTGSIALGQFNQPGKIDNVTPLADDIILVRTESLAYTNGLYSITNPGSPSSSFVLTRVSYYDTGSEVYPSQIIGLRGTSNANQTFIQQTVNPTVGSSSLVYTQSPSTSTQVLPILFVDTVTTGPLPAYTYATGSTYTGFPGYEATLTAVVTGSLGVIGGVTASSNIRILAVSESNSVYNGTYKVTAPGTNRVGSVAGTPWRLTRIDYWTSMQPNFKEFVVSRFGATEYGSRYVLQSSSITPANIGISQSLIFRKYLSPSAGGGITSAFPFTGSALITGSLGITGSVVITGSTDTALVRITQTGTGNAFVVEDSTNPDASPFVINNAGRVGIGTTTLSASLDVKASSSSATDTVFKITNAANTSSILDIAGNGAFTYNANTGSITFIEGSAAGVGQRFILQRSTYSASFTIGNNGGTTLATDGLVITSNASAIELNGGPSGGSFFQSVDLKGNSNLSARVNSTGQFAFTSNTSWFNSSGSFTYTGDKVIIDGHTMAFRSASVAPTNTLDTFKLYSADVVAGNAAPHFRTEAGNIVKLYSQGPVTSAQGIADALTNLGLLTGSSLIVTASTPGPVGIANTSGSYVYYSSFSASLAAASSGSTVEFFADIIETGSISVNLKNDVNINGNGHTYTLNTAGTASCIIDNGVAVNCSISNITFKRLGGTASSTNTLCMHITGASIIKAYGTKLIGGATNMRCLTINNLAAQVFGVYAEGYNPCITVTNGQLFDSTGKSIGGGGITVEANGTAIKCIGYGFGSAGILSYGRLIDCIGYGQVNGGIASYSGLIQNCTGYGVGGPGLYISGGTTVVINSTGYSLSNEGILTSSNINIGLQGYSTAGPGITLVNGILTNCTGYSTSTNGIYMYNSGPTIGELRSCKAISTAAAAIYQNNLTPGSKIYNTEAISRWSNVLGHGVIVSGSNTEIVQCVIETTSPLANCIFPTGSSAITVKYANNVMRGANVAVNANIIQGMINTHDNQGNIII